MLLRKILLGALVPMSIGVSIIGAGYSVWDFDNKTQEVSGTGTVEGATNGIAVTPTTLTMKLDQGDKNNDGAGGITFTDGTNAVTELKVTYTGTDYASANPPTLSNQFTDVSGVTANGIATYVKFDASVVPTTDDSADNKTRTWKYSLASLYTYDSTNYPQTYNAGRPWRGKYSQYGRT